MRFQTARRALLHAAWPALAALLPWAAHAQAPTDFPTRPLRMVVPFGPGTSTDTVARVVAEAVGRQLNQTVVVENRAGSGGVIGTEAVARAPADGYTLVMGTVGTHAINPALYRKLPYDAARDFAPLGFVGQTPTLLVVAAGSPLQSLQDLRAAAARAPGVSFASAGNGTSGHLAGDLLRRALGGQMVHVPYKDGAVGLSDVIAGQVQFMFYHPAAVLPQIKAGKLRALGVSSARPSQAAPEVPTLQALTGQPFDLVAWFMVYAPAATPAPLLARLREATRGALAAPETQARLTAQGLEGINTHGDALAAFGVRETDKWGELVRQSGAQVD